MVAKENPQLLWKTLHRNNEATMLCFQAIGPVKACDLDFDSSRSSKVEGNGSTVKLKHDLLLCPL